MQGRDRGFDVNLIHRSVDHGVREFFPLQKFGKVGKAVALGDGIFVADDFSADVIGLDNTDDLHFFGLFQ